MSVTYGDLLGDNRLGIPCGDQNHQMCENQPSLNNMYKTKTQVKGA